MDLEGIIPPMITPTAGGRVDHDQLATFTERLVGAGVDGLLPVGSVGEFPSLSPTQRRDVIDTVVDHAGACPVIAGCGGTSVGGVTAQIDAAATAGAHAALVVTPYYFSPSQAGLQRFYREVAARVDLPIFLYDIPAFTGTTLEPASVRSLAAEPGIVGLKDSTGDVVDLADLLADLPDRFTVLQGHPAIGPPSIEAGADGIVAGPANLFPEPTVAWHRAYVSGERDRAVQLGRDVIMSTLRAKRGMPSPAAFKHLLDRAGFPVGEPLAPLERLRADQRERLNDRYDGIIAAADPAIPW